MNQLEMLLNKLIKMGWKPWGKDVDKITIPPKEQFDEDRYLFVDVMFPSGFSRYYTQRELVSYNSGLWQFVCENKLYKEHNGKIERYFDFNEDDYLFHYARDYQYRLIESALVPEDKLGQFLVENIVMEG